MSLDTRFREPPLGAYTQLEDLLGLRFAARELTLSPKRQSRAQQSGGFRARFRGRGMEFEEVRHYQAGDDIRNIDWRVTARTGTAHTKMFREERERPVILVVDQRSSMFFGTSHCFKSVTAAHAAALLGWAALSNNDRVGALIFSDKEEDDIRPKRSRHTLLAILDSLHRFNGALTSPISNTESLPLDQRLRDLRRIARPGSALLILSDFHDVDDASEEQLFQLARHCDITLLPVSDPFEQQLPPNMMLTVTNGRQRRILDTRNRELANHYRSSFTAHFERLQTLSARLALPLVTLPTCYAPLQQLNTVFGRHSWRG